MAELDPSIVLKAFATPQLDIAGTMQAAQERKRQMMLQERQDSDYARQQQAQQAALARQQQAGQLAAQGQFDQADQAALSAGDFELHKHIASLKDEQRAQGLARVRSAVPVAIEALQVQDPAQRRAMIQAQAPNLMQNGWKPEELASFEPTDANLKLLIGSARTAENALAEYDKAHAPYSLNQGERRFDGDNRMVAQGAPKDPSYDVLQGADGTLYRVNKTDGSATPITVGGAPSQPGTAGGNGNSALATNPGALKDGPFARSQPGYTGSSSGFATFANPQQGVAAQEALLQSRYIGRGLNTVDKIVSTYAPQGPENSAASVANYKKYVAQRAGISTTDRITPDKVSAVAAAMREFETGNRPQGGNQPLRGLSKEKNTTTKDTMEMRKEFDQLPEVKTFKTVRASMQQIQALARNPNASATDDVALIFSYMKMLDPNSVVREGEFATAQNTAGIPDQIKNAYNKALSGNRLNQNQRMSMLNSATKVYLPIRENYNAAARQYQGYARDIGINPNSIAREYQPVQPAQQRQGPARVTNEADYNKLPAGSMYIGPDGHVRKKR
jgi:hypothetical protein